MSPVQAMILSPAKTTLVPTAICRPSEQVVLAYFLYTALLASFRGIAPYRILISWAIPVLKNPYSTGCGNTLHQLLVTVPEALGAPFAHPGGLFSNRILFRSTALRFAEHFRVLGWDCFGAIRLTTGSGKSRRLDSHGARVDLSGFVRGSSRSYAFDISLPTVTVSGPVSFHFLSRYLSRLLASAPLPYTCPTGCLSGSGAAALHESVSRHKPI